MPLSNTSAPLTPALPALAERTTTAPVDPAVLWPEDRERTPPVDVVPVPPMNETMPPWPGF